MKSNAAGAERQRLDEAPGEINGWHRLARKNWRADRYRVRYLDVGGPIDIASDILMLPHSMKNAEWSEWHGAVPPPVDDPLITQIAGLAHVRANGLARLQQGISLELEREWRWHREPQHAHDEFKQGNGPARVQLRQLKRLSSELDAAVRNLNSVALFYLQAASSGILVKANKELGRPLEPGGCDFDQIKEMVAALAERASEAVRYSRPTPSRNPVGRRPRGGFGQTVFRPGSLKLFTLRLLWDVRAAGGRLTLDKNSGNGTLPETLKLLSPHLPPGFIPNVLPFSTLASVKALDKKLAAIA
jgi:hypothetical protein